MDSATYQLVCMSETPTTQAMPDTKRKLLDAAMRLMLQQGYTATTVDQVCVDAGLTKGSFFHYFKSKEQIGAEAIDYFSCCQAQSHRAASFSKLTDPLERILGMLDFIIANADDPDCPKACLVGNLAQELSDTNSTLRNCCEQSFGRWTAWMSAELEAAKILHAPKTDFNPDSVATLMLSLMQGSLLVAKTRQDAGVIVQNVQHCRRYIESLFGLDRK